MNIIAPAAESGTAPAAEDAAAIFANLYRRWTGDACALSERSMQGIRALAGQRVADVLSIWDEQAGTWLPGGPTVIRLAAHDVAVFVMRGPFIAVHQGDVETRSPVATFGPPRRSPGESGARHPLFWRRMRPCSYAFGRTITGFAFETDARKRLLALEIILDDEGRLRIGGSGIDCSGATPRTIPGYRANAAGTRSRAS